LPFARLDGLTLTEMACSRKQRLSPPVLSLPRRAVCDFPAGAGIKINALYTYHMPQIWPEPERYDPSRFDTEASRGTSLLSCCSVVAPKCAWA
jgi:cytochrome P450